LPLLIGLPNQNKKKPHLIKNNLLLAILLLKKIFNRKLK